MTVWIIVGVIAFAVLLCFLLAVANFSGERFFERFEEVNKIEVRGNHMPLKFVDDVNKNTFEGKLQVVQISGIATDAYSKGKLFLSTNTIGVNSIASYTIIAHEMGHALQDKKGKKLKHMIALRRFGKFLGMLFAPSLIAGLVLLPFSYFTWAFVLFGLAGFILLLSLFVKLRTISIEKDASAKAVSFLNEYLTDNEMKIAKKFLKDAKLTYWADFLRTLLWWTGMSRKSKLFN